jgi:hypothetical protein
MKPIRLALLSIIVLGLSLGFGSAARADHEFGHNHPFCAQGGGQAGDSSGGPGGTIPDEDALTEANNGGEVPKTVLIPTHLGPKFGEDDPRGIDPDAQFIEISSKDVADSDSTGSNGSAFHGGHGGGPGGGQGGSTFFGAGDGGCSPVIAPTSVSRPPTQPGRRLPVTGGLTEQLALMSGLLLSSGWLLSLVTRRKAAAVTDVTAPRGPVFHHEVVSRLKEQVKGLAKVGGPIG